MLTTREQNTLRLLAEGLSNAEIATRLQPGEATVKSHVSAVLARLGLRARIQAAVLGHEIGLGREESPWVPAGLSSRHRQRGWVDAGSGTWWHGTGPATSMTMASSCGSDHG